MLKQVILKIIGPDAAGSLDYILKRKAKDPWGGPFNNQKERQQIFADILAAFDFAAIVETGTFRGCTTEHFAKVGLPTYSVEIDSRAQAFARRRLAEFPNVELFKGDSPQLLQTLSRRPDVPKGTVFFYLDAHVQDSSMYHKAPLCEELNIIFKNWANPIVMIDDFAVPGKSYSFDNWGDGRNLDLNSLGPVRDFGFTAFFPSADAEKETGMKRGCVILCKTKASVQKLSELSNLSIERGENAPPLPSNS